MDIFATILLVIIIFKKEIGLYIQRVLTRREVTHRPNPARVLFYRRRNAFSREFNERFNPEAQD